MKYLLIPLLLLSGCSSYRKYIASQYKDAQISIDDPFYVSDMEFEQGKYISFRESNCKEIESDVCKAKFFDKFIEILSKSYSVSVKEIELHCVKHKGICSGPRETEKVVRQLHNESDRLVREKDWQLWSNGLTADKAKLTP